MDVSVQRLCLFHYLWGMHKLEKSEFSRMI